MGLRKRLLWLVLVACTAGAGEVGIAARVNDVEISNFRLQRYFTEFLAAHGRNLGAIRDPRTYQRLQGAALDDLIDKELLWQEAERQGVQVDEAAMREHFEQMRGAFRSADDFSRRLERAGFDEVSYLDYLRREQVSRRMLEKLSKVSPVSQNDVLMFLQQNPSLSSGSEEEIEGARQLLQSSRQADAARAALERLRDESRIERVTGGF